jgi:hypothetical protein
MALLQQVDVCTLISDTIVSVTQDISQGLQASQIISVDCSQSDKSDVCLDCVQTLSDLQKNQGEDVDQTWIQEQCKSTCICEVSEADINAHISCNFSALLDKNMEAKFVTAFKNNMYLDAQQKNSSFPGMASNQEVLDVSISKVFQKLNSETIQTSLQSIQTLQNINLKGPGEVKAINLSLMVTMVSTVILKSSEMQESLNDLTTIITTKIMQTTQSGFSYLILRMIQILVIVVLGAMFGFIIQLFFQVFTLQTSL